MKSFFHFFIATRIRQIIFSTILVLGLAFGGFVGYEAYFSAHFYVVIPGQVYRIREMNKAGFEEYIKKYHIQSVINLQGAQPNAPWYQAELAATQATGAHHFDVSLPSHGLPQPNNFVKMVQILQTAPQPMLIHCRQGFDRSGLASAIALILDENAPAKKAERQFSYRYLVFLDNSIGKVVMPHYNAWLTQNKLPDDETSFLTWVDLVGQQQSFNVQGIHPNPA